MNALDFQIAPTYARTKHSRQGGWNRDNVRRAWFAIPRWIRVAMLIALVLLIDRQLPYPIPSSMLPGEEARRWPAAWVSVIDWIGCGDSWQGRARVYRQASPAFEVRRALEKGDERYIGVMGYALIVPGVDWRPAPGDDLRSIREELKIIRGTSDAIESKSHREFCQAAADFARRYNQLLEKELAARIK